MARNKSATNKNVEVAVNTQNAAVVSSPVVSSNGAIEMTNANANISNIVSAMWANREVYVKQDFVPAISLTEEQIVGMTHENILWQLVSEKRIGVTQAPNLTRENGGRIMWQNKYAFAQLGAALANIEFAIHDFGFEEDHKSRGYEMGLWDRVGTHNYHIAATVDAQGYVRYTTSYGKAEYNELGRLRDFVAGKVHPVESYLDDSILYGYVGKDGVRRDGYNQWAEKFNAQAKEYIQSGVIGDLIAKSLSDLKAEGITDLNQIAQRLVRRTIRRETVINQFVLEAWLLQDESRPAFSIYAQNKSEESFALSMNARNEQLLNGYRNALRFLSGLRKTEPIAVTE
jgi:hypothetical protein